MSKHTCFVIMPFGRPSVDPKRARKLSALYAEWIKPTVESIADVGNEGCQIECHRADKSERPAEIINHIISHLAEADIVIADLTGQNANVFYELGVRHAVRSNTILIAEQMNDIPFDLRALRAIEYEYTPEGMRAFERRLGEAVRSILRSPNEIDNPVRRYLFDKAVHDLITQAVPPGYDAVRNMAEELVELRREFKSYAKQTRSLMEALATTSAIGSSGQATERHEFGAFEGLWSSDTGGLLYGKCIDGKLFIPYSFSDEKKLTGHYYDCRMAGDTLVAKFEWFAHDIAGYACQKLINHTKTEGGWWTGKTIPDLTGHDPLKDALLRGGMVPNCWYKAPAKVSPPKWALDYFEKKRYLKRS